MDMHMLVVRMTKLAVILAVGAIFLFFVNDALTLHSLPDYYVLCPDGTIVALKAEFCSDRKELECDGRLCKLSKTSPFYHFYGFAQ